MGSELKEASYPPSPPSGPGARGLFTVEIVATLFIYYMTERQRNATNKISTSRMNVFVPISCPSRGCRGCSTNSSLQLRVPYPATRGHSRPEVHQITVPR